MEIGTGQWGTLSLAAASHQAVDHRLHRRRALAQARRARIERDPALVPSRHHVPAKTRAMLDFVVVLVSG